MTGSTSTSRCRPRSRRASTRPARPGPRGRPCAGELPGPAPVLRRGGGGRGGWYGKVKLHLTRDTSRRRLGRSREARLLGVLRGRGAVGARARWLRVRRRPPGWAAVSVALGGAILAAVLGLGLDVNLSSSAPRGVYRAVAGTPARGAWVAACVSREAAALGRARGYLGAGVLRG